ncbi:hypothetical protein B5F07_09040 [Lachnoclostridium sp. An169]|mgnify:CR=1 FL=1|uniref:MFS transporter n=1 Tax=Lachnoclostridium sp. An169 TaxID=1965569 RepID=UPI000B387BAF|nr:MFS transporter [Lachnoclostridium sp. An169]OUP83987.1 hypothetical protein B5F07_09040 [Lachnoclostridium sp. An169]
MGKEKKAQKHAGWLTTKKERRYYIMGDLARSFNSTMFNSYVTLFLMFQGVDLTSVAIVTLLIKVVDSVDDVVFGYLVDRIHLEKMKRLKKILGAGKYLPWYRFTFLMFPLATVLFYLMPSGLPQAGKIAWYVVTFLLFDLTYTLCEVPMNSLIITLTDNMEERHHIQTVKAMWVVVSAVLLSVVSSFLISEFVGLPIQVSGISMTVIFTVMMIPFALKGKEHNAELKNPEGEEREEYTFRQMFRCLKENKYLLVYIVSLFISTVLISLNSAMGMFVGFYIFHNSQASSIATLVMFIPALLLMTQAQKICTKLGGNQRTLIIMSAFYTLIYTLLFLFGRMNIVIYVIIMILVGLPNSVLGVIRSFVLPDTIEYARYKTGQDCSGICYALLSFVNKMTASVGGSIGMMILALFGWVSVNATDFADLAAQNVAQPQSAIDALWCISTLVPAIGAAVGALLLIFYRLDDKDAKLMAKCNAGEITREECEAQLSRKY